MAPNRNIISNLIDNNTSRESTAEQEQTPLFAKPSGTIRLNDQTVSTKDGQKNQEARQNRHISYEHLSKMIKELGRKQNKSLRRIQAQMSEASLIEEVQAP